jgi:hypothetical protein
MKPDKGLDRKDEPDEPLQNQPLEWADEDHVIEDRKPDLGEIEEDTSEPTRGRIQHSVRPHQARGRSGHFAQKAEFDASSPF